MNNVTCLLANVSWIDRHQAGCHFSRLLKQYSSYVCTFRVLLQSAKEKDVVNAVNACSKLFCTLLEKKELFLGKLPGEEEALSGEYRLIMHYAAINPSYEVDVNNFHTSSTAVPTAHEVCGISNETCV